MTEGAHLADGDRRFEDDADAYMSAAEIRAYGPAGACFRGADRHAPVREGLARWGNFGPTQLAGRTFPIACVALEVTQRCNLDCTLCYLSDRAEMVHDMPLREIERRIDMIHDHYGDHTNIQITGGDPTLRNADDLEAIVRYVRSKNMRSALFTNGIRASRALLKRLAAAGLNDVSFHVDLTQERKGYASEDALNAVRDDYLGRAQGLGLRVNFNTTVFDGNVDEVPMLARFFLARADRVNLASFQMQADTGRGTLRVRDGAAVHQQGMIAAIEAGVGATLDFDVIEIGHPRCNRYAAVLAAGGDVASLYCDRPLMARLFPAIAADDRDWNVDAKTIRAALGLFVRRPRLGLKALRWAGGLAWRLRRGLVRSRGRAHRLSFFIHNFMDAERLERDRCDGCVFTTMTANGPLSMCVHNAQRDRHVFAPVPVATAEGRRYWNPATGRVDAGAETAPPDAMPFKKLKGRARAAAERARAARRPA